jgi:GT2 family glycosyltransferase
VIHQENLGSAGGFCRGIEESLRRGHGWTWIFDDDAIPRLDALAQLADTPYFQRPDTAFLASRIVDPRGKTYMSPPAVEANRWYATVLEDGCVEVSAGCWLGLLVASAAVRKSGLPVAEFFLWDEDVEFTTRLSRGGSAYCAIRSVIVHYQAATFDPRGKDFIKYAYWARNRVARAKIEPGPWPRKVIVALRRASWFLGQVARGEAPVRTIPWVLRGLFTFWPRIRFPE